MTGDQAHRDRIATDLDSTLFVEAAAGTGKTTALVRRVVEMVARGVELPSIAAITFTEKAAAELRDRVRRGLTEAVGERPGPEAERCATALTQLEDAAITTLHSFARRILADFPLEAGLPPRFDVLDDIEAAGEFDAAYDRFAGDLLEDADDTVRQSLALGLRPSDLRTLAAACRDHWDRLEGHAFPEPPMPRIDVDAVIAPLTEALALEHRCADPDDRLARHLELLRPAMERLAAATDDVDRLSALAEAPTFAKRVGVQRNWGKAAIEQVRDHLSDADDARELMLRGTCGALTARLAARVQRFTLEEAERRRAEGRLEFQDLLVLARRLLRAHGDVRAALRDRWQRILIDEFQDTDPLQIEIAVLLATPTPGVIRDDWSIIEVDPGRLFLVGDPKQSIYRFRRADIALYQRVQDRFADGHVPLHANFRCAPPIITWVNTVFDALLGAGQPGRQAPYVTLEATRHTHAPSVRYLGGAHDRTPMAEIREREAEDIAAAVSAARDEGWAVHNPGSDEARAARLGDVAILLPTRALLPELERALAEADVPYRIESRSLLWATQEVRELLATLRSIDDPADEIALVATLRSPGFACRDDELLEWRRHGGAWNYLAPAPSALADHPVTRAMQGLRELHEAIHWTPLHAIVERVIRTRNLIELQVAKRRPRDHWRRLRFVADQARAFHASGGLTMRGFVDWAEQQADEGASVNESVVPEPDDDAVAIMTVHASKGLEFPIVVLAGLGTFPPHRRPPVVFRRTAVEVALGRKDDRFETPGYEQALGADRLDGEAEGLRLLYVATTRARDHLVVSLHHKAGTRACHAHGIVTKVPNLDALEALAAGLGAAPALTLAPITVPNRDTWVAERARIVEHARARVMAATTVGRVHEPEPPETPPWQRGRAGTAVGRAVHAVLQSVDLATGEGVESLAAAQADAEGVPDRRSDITRAVRAALGSDAVRAAVASKRFWREVYVGAEVNGVVLEGFIDLLFERQDGLVVVDYKTDRVDGAAGVSDHYRLQAGAYAAALGETLGQKVAACTFVFVGSGTAVEIDIPDLPAAVRDVHAALEDW